MGTFRGISRDHFSNTDQSSSYSRLTQVNFGVGVLRRSFLIKVARFSIFGLSFNVNSFVERGFHQLFRLVFVGRFGGSFDERSYYLGHVNGIYRLHSQLHRLISMLRGHLGITGYRHLVHGNSSTNSYGRGVTSVFSRIRGQRSRSKSRLNFPKDLVVTFIFFLGLLSRIIFFVGRLRGHISNVIFFGLIIWGAGALLLYHGIFLKL